MRLHTTGFLRVFALLFALFWAQTDCSTLKGLFVVFRHGNRAPYLFYQQDPYRDLAYWPNGLAQLTKAGEVQMTKIGEYLRGHYYADLKINDTNQIEIRTTNVVRVRKSAELVFRGFVANTPLEKSSQFIPLRMDLELFRKLSAEHKITFADEYKDFVSDDSQAFHQLVDSFLFESNENFTLPSWVTPELHEKLKRLDDETFNSVSSTKILNQINAGPLLYDFGEKIKKLVQPKSSSQAWNFASVNEGEKAPKLLSLYSGTDIVLDNLLVGLKVFEPIHHLTPPPACAIIFELHQEPKRIDLDWDESSFVKMLYFNRTAYPINSDPFVLQNVTVRSFLSSISDLSLNRDDWIKACYGVDTASSHPDRTILLVIIVVLAVLSALLLIALCILKRNYNRKKVSFNFMHDLKN